jgi:hypothetical protein
MAKELSIKQEIYNDPAVNQEFNILRTYNQVGDKFYVPMEEMLLVLGTHLEANGNKRARTVGQYFPVVRLVDGVPTEVTNLYVGQLVRLDINRVIAYPGPLSDALRKSSWEFKSLICDKILEITESKEIVARVWDDDKKEWKRNEDGTFASKDAFAFKFVPKANNMSDAVLDTCLNMLEEHYKTNYADLVETLNID